MVKLELVSNNTDTTHPNEIPANREIELAEAERDLGLAQTKLAHTMLRAGYLLESLVSGHGLSDETPEVIMKKYNNERVEMKNLELKISRAEHRLEILKAKKTY